MNHVLITGATGVIGTELVPLFLQSGDCQVSLLIRADSPAHLQTRLDRLYEYWELTPNDRSLKDRVIAFCGDVSQPRLGLDRNTFDQLGSKLTHVVHCAGNVKLNQSMDEARTNTIDPVRHVVELARTSQQRGIFRKLDVISTIGVAGRMPGLIPERPLTESRGFHNTYEAAKAEAEEFLLKQLDEGLPLTIHRPSMVVGNSRTGRISHFQVFYYLCEFLTGKRTRGFVVDTGDATLDIVPVDYVAQAIYIASRHADAVGKIFHLCSGPEQAIQLTDLSKRLRAFATTHGEQLPRLRPISDTLLRRLLPWATRLSHGDAQRALKSLPFFLAYLGERQTFDTTNTQAFYATHALTLPPVDRYLDRILGFYRKTQETHRNGAVQSSPSRVGEAVAVDRQ
ncbi:MAG: SDR family oxidoreductase [Pirellulales bacterium]|nr:SDR family oxidoreductase [Pirellulales bacterium]